MTELAVTIFLIIVPGIIALLIVSNLVIHKPFSNFFFSLYSIVLGMFSYMALQLSIWIFNFSKNLICTSCSNYYLLKTWQALEKKAIIACDLKEIIYASLFCIPIAFITSLIINKKWLHKLATKWKISNKYGDENLYYYYLNASEVDWVYIRDKENEFIYQGRVAIYSENEKIHEIVLAEVSVFNFYEPEDIIFTAPTMYISRPLGKIQIEQIPTDKFIPKKGEGE